MYKTVILTNKIERDQFNKEWCDYIHSFSNDDYINDYNDEKLTQVDLDLENFYHGGEVDGYMISNRDRYKLFRYRKEDRCR